MKSWLAWFLLGLGAGVVPAQVSSSTVSSHSGWSFQDTLEQASDMVVGTIVSSDCADSGTQVACRATVRVARVLKGATAPQQNIAIRWEYHPGPMDGPSATRHVPEVTALWFLHAGSEGGYMPYASPFVADYGGVYLTVLAAQPAGAFFYAGDAKVGAKIALEIGSALTANAAPLESGLQILDNLSIADTADVYRVMSESPVAKLKAAGLAGRLRGGEATALIELEADLPRLSNMSALYHIGFAGTLKLRDQPAAAQALAHLALSEMAIPELEHEAPLLLADTGNVEFLPVLMVMLHNPETEYRRMALWSVCKLAGPMSGPAGHCREDAGLAADIQWWQEWWQTERTRIPKLAELRDLPLPVRYAQMRPQPQPMEVPQEMRFYSLAVMLQQPTHFHTADGAFQEGNPSGGADPFTARMSGEDHATLVAVVARMNAKLEDIDKDAQKMMSEARFSGGRPDLQQMQAINRRRTDAMKTGLAEAQDKLSPEGWAMVEEFMGAMNIHVGGGAMASPRP